jgi:hypothetical protein
LSAAAPGSALSIAIKMMNQAALNIPSSVAVPAGSTNANFYINTATVKKQREVTLQASLNGSSVTTLLTLKP